MKKDQVIKRGPFEALIKGELIEVWLGPSYFPEGEYLLSLDRHYLPQLIALLRAVEEAK